MASSQQRKYAGKASLVAALTLLPLIAWADDKILADAGIWKTESGTASGVADCSIESQTGYKNEQLLLDANLTQPRTVSLIFLNALRWNFENGTKEAVTLAYDDGTSQILDGTFSDGALTVELDSRTFPEFLHDFTARKRLTVTIQDDSHPFTYDLTGTSSAVTAMGDCTRASGFTELPSPFAPAPAPSVDQGKAAPSPFVKGNEAPPPPGSFVYRLVTMNITKEIYNEALCGMITPAEARSAVTQVQMVTATKYDIALSVLQTDAQEMLQGVETHPLACQPLENNSDRGLINRIIVAGEANGY